MNVNWAPQSRQVSVLSVKDIGELSLTFTATGIIGIISAATKRELSGGPCAIGGIAWDTAARTKTWESSLNSNIAQFSARVYRFCDFYERKLWHEICPHLGESRQRDRFWGLSG